MRDRLDYTRDGGRYFAFVESMDELDGDVLKTREGLPDHWLDMLAEREALGMQLPTHCIWLDCVRCDYFSGLTWSGRTCRRNDVEDGNRRRQQLLELDPDQLATVLLVMNHDDGALEPFQEGSWHDIELKQWSGLPVVAASDFDLIAAQRCYFGWLREVEAADRRLLQNVFNLDFLPDAGGGEWGGSPPRPGNEPSWKDVGDAYSRNRPLLG
jgi:hypothetical protein